MQFHTVVWSSEISEFKKFNPKFLLCYIDLCFKDSVLLGSDINWIPEENNELNNKAFLFSFRKDKILANSQMTFSMFQTAFIY